jgi:N-methylhydantoinase B
MIAPPADFNTQVSVDPVSLEIIRGAMRAIQAEMEVLIERTAMSAFIREKKDFSSGVYDGAGRMIAGKSLPMASDLVSPVLAVYPADEMQPGDVYWYNDCYASRGAVTHTPDQVLIAPAFVEGRLVGFSQTWAHFADIGGMRPGSISPDCTDIFQEGTIVPPVRLVAAGRLQEELLRLFVRNSRFPTMVQGDMRALMAATRLGERRIGELATRFGADRLCAAFDELVSRTRKAVRARLRATVPQGEVRFADALDTDGHGSGPIWLRYRLTTDENGSFVLDATASDDQAKGPVNFIMSPTNPGMLVGTYLIADAPEVSLNAGAEDLFDEVLLREGSILQPRFPAPLGQRGITLLRNLACYLGLLNVASGGQAPAAHSPYGIWLIRGIDESGRPFLMSDGVATGYGARPMADGHDAVYLVAQENYPAEFVDSTYPLRVRRYAINPDTGGPGRWRGGCGVSRELEVLAPEALLSVRLDAIANPPWGVNGGLCAGSGRCVVNPGTPQERVLAPLSDGNRVRRGDVVLIETGGGGGWGHPFDREPERVLADVMGGFVSAESALRDYGVVLRADGRAVDAEATARRRADRPAAKLFHRGTYRDSLE